MSSSSQYVLSIAGFDPCGGAGVLADIKTFEEHGCNGMAVTTAITGQNEDEFVCIKWLSWPEVEHQLRPLLNRYKFNVIKFGLVESGGFILNVCDLLNEYDQKPTLIWDTVLKSSSGFDFENDISDLNQIYSKLDLITPNLEEFKLLMGKQDELTFTTELRSLCSILLKGGHASNHADDTLFTQKDKIVISGERIPNAQKHGTGCVLSSAIASNLAVGYDLEMACRKAKVYLTSRIESPTKLIVHRKKEFV